MVSGRYRTEAVMRFWSNNREGYCLLPSCYGVLGTLEHMLLDCESLEQTRRNLFEMWIHRTQWKHPYLLPVIENLLHSDNTVLLQFILNPATHPDIIFIAQNFDSSVIDHVFYLARTFAFCMHKQKLKLCDEWHGIS